MNQPFFLSSRPGEDCITQYGAICWRMNRGHVQVLLITSRDTGRWVIPKGWPVDKMTPAASAAQEAWEEAGVEGKVQTTRLGQFSYDKIVPGQSPVLCAVDVFALRVAKLRANFPERKERRRKWFDASKAARKVAEPDLRHLLQNMSGLLVPDDPARLAIPGGIIR